MARLRQQYPNNYVGSGNISTEFENVIRYLVSAEKGGKTLGEMMEVLFDDDGEFDGPIEMRRDLSGDIQYRVGEYDTDTGWQTLVAAADLRGATGVDAGEIGAPIIHSRFDVTPANTATVVTYAHDETDELLVYIDGVLQREGVGYDYVHDANANTVTFATPFTGAEAVTVYKIRATLITGYTRTDTETVASQAVFPFIHDESTQLNVYKNGLLQREGGSFDYTTSPATDTVTFNTAVPAGNVVSILTVENTSAQVVTGLMMEKNFVDLTTGLIKLTSVAIADDAIPQTKIANLTTDLAARATRTVSATTPVTPATGDLWLDTSVTPNQLKFWDGARWLRTSPNSLLPSFDTEDANLILRVNGTGTGLEYAALDLSSAVLKTSKGAANGVASLDADGKLPGTQLPAAISTDTLYQFVATPAAQGYTTKRIFQQRLSLVGIAIRMTSGTCSVQVAINGVGTGPTYSASSTPNEISIGVPIEVDGTGASVGIGFIVSSPASAANLEVSIAASVLTD